MIEHEVEAQPNLGGRPPHEPTARQREEVETLSGYGMTHGEIATFIGISRPTLEGYYKEELRIGRVRADAKVAGALFKKATSDEHPQATTAAIWWEKTRAGRREPKQEFQHSGSVGLYDLSKLGDTQLADLEGILISAAVAGANPSGEGETGG